MAEKNYVKVGGQLQNIVGDGILAYSKEIKDEVREKTQEQINTETYEKVAEIDEALSSLSPEQGEALALSERVGQLEKEVGYYECSTSSGTATKQVVADGYALSSGCSIKVKMANKNTAASNVMLKIGSSEAKPLYYAGKLVSAANTWDAGEVLDIYYNPNNGGAYYANNVEGGSADGVFDVSDYNKSGDPLAPTKYIDLAAALGTNGNNIPENHRKGGMLIKFIELESLEYKQYRYMGTAVSGTSFTNTANWQGADSVPTEDSKNLVESGGVYEECVEAGDPVGDPVGDWVPSEAEAYVDQKVAEERARAIARENQLLKVYETFTQSNLVIGALPATGKVNTIYRVPGTNSYADYMYAASDLHTPILMAIYNNDIDEIPTAGSQNLVKSGGVAREIVWDVTARNSNATFASLSALLSDANLATLIPTPVRRGGMQIRFVLSSDNKYVQYLYKVTDAATAATFTNVANWEKVNLEAELLSLKIINNTYPNLIFETGKAVLTDGRIMALSGTNVCLNVPVIPNSKIRLTLLTVSSGGGRGFVFFDQNGKFISAVSAVTGTKVYDIDVPSNAITLAITLWENTNSFTMEVNTSTTNVHNSIYRDLAPQIWGIQKITQNETINGLISELYFPRWIFDTKVVGYYPRRFFAIQPWDSTIVLSIYNTSSTAICIARTEVITVGKVLEAKIYQTNDTDLPIGMTLGYVICNDIPKSFNNRIEVVAGNYVCALKNSPQVAAYMASRNNDFSQSIQLCLPDNITAIVGDTLQVFYRGIVFSPMPDKYDVLVTCSKGFICPRYWEYTPTPSDVGTTTFKIQVKNDNRGIIAEKTCTLTTKAKVSSPASNKNVLCFGASTTQNGEWPHEANRRLTGSGGTPEADGLTNITFCGSKTKEGTGYFGAGGWNWHSYTTSSSISYRFQVSGVGNLSLGAKYTNNGNTFTVIEINVTSGSGNILCSVSSLTPTPLASGTLTKSSGNGDASITYSSVSEDTQNPLWDSANNKMSFIPYANAYCNGQIDFVYVWLGANGLASGQRDFTSILADVKTFADTLHTEFPNAKLKIMGEALPSHRGGMGANYGASGYWADEYGMLLAFFNLSDAYQGFANQSEYSSFVEFVNVATQFDIDFNMPHTEKAVNVRNTEVTEWIDTNGVHPALSGYMQVADVVYRNIIKELQ